MAVDRPTFHEAWYRVAQMRPRLLPSVQVYRQHFRGRMWYVLENPTNNRFSRISPEAYRFIALLDGRRTVDEVWHICNEQLGDDAPTQGEAIQLLGQLYSSNLLYAEMAPDTVSLLSRYRTRIKRQIQGFLGSLLFVRIPLLDPDSFLDRWVSIVGKIFTLPGLMVWLTVLATGLYFVIGNFRELVHQSSDVLAPDNLILLYLSLVLVKVVHEFSHSFACKRFGRGREGGQVHTMGVMFLVFFPLPYMDASSAWAFRKKSHRAVVGMAGVMAELFAAAVAAIVWANTSTGTLHIIAYNVIFVASVSTLIFNGNPLLRFDAYYVLSDLLEIPNLGQRCRQYLYYLVKRYCWGLKKAHNPSHTTGESVWFVIYGISSTAYRVFICIRILLFLNSRLPEELFILVPVLAALAIITWLLVPLGRFVRYLITGAELSRVRTRAVSTTVAALIVVVLALGIIPFPDHCRVEGIVEPADLRIVHTLSDGFVQSFLASEQTVSPTSGALVSAVSPQLSAEKKAAAAELAALRMRRRVAELGEIAAAQILDEQIQAFEEKTARLQTQLDWLNLPAPADGIWICPDAEQIRGMYLPRGEKIGYVATLDEVMIRATAGQNLAALLVEQGYEELEIRVRGFPDKLLKGELQQIFPAGQRVLPSVALGYAAGGSMPVSAEDRRGIKAAENFFEVRIKPRPDGNVRLLTGQRVTARIKLPSRPLAAQWWRSLRQLFQKRFFI